MHELYGALPCKACTKRQRAYKPRETIEITTNSIKEDRKKFSKDILQPYRSGQVSKEYIEAYGTERIEATPQEIKNARNVWDDLGYYKKEG